MPNTQHILIIEDDSKWQAVLRETLEDEDYDVTLVANYQHGRQTLEKRPFDLIILDLNLDEKSPTLDGERLLRRISRHHANTPCIIVSGQGDVHVVRNAFKQYHVVDFIAKDQFDISTFIQTVKDALGWKQADDTAPPQQPASAREQADSVAQEKRAAERQYHSRLLQILVNRFDGSELRMLCFQLGIDYEDSLPGESKEDKALDLIKRLERRDRILELVQAGKQLRPDIAWDDMA
jgi:DNA-binding NtrC family response regulator